MPANEVIRRLRERGEPIRLFGEADDDRAERLRQLEISQPEVNRVGRTSDMSFLFML